MGPKCRPRPGQRSLGERFFAGVYAKHVLGTRLAKFLVAFWVVVVIALAGVSIALLGPAQDEPKFFPDDHAFQIWEDANEEFGGSSDEVVSWTVSFGLAPRNRALDRRGNDFQREIWETWCDRKAPKRVPDEDAEEEDEEERTCHAPTMWPQFGDTDFNDPDVQTELLAFCDGLGAHADTKRKSDCEERSVQEGIFAFTLRCAAVGCVFQDAKDYLGGNGTKFTGSWPYANLADVLVDPEFSFYSQRLQQLCASSGLDSPQTGCKEKGTFCYVTWQTTTKEVDVESYEGKKLLHYEMEDLVANLLPRVEYYHYGGPATIWLRTQEELLRSTSSSLGACMGFSFLVLLVGTRNPLLTSIFILGIGSVVTCVIGTITAMGWVLGIMEATGIIVVVGLAVDYSAHLVHAYHTAGVTDRVGRSLHAATTMGTSVLAGALTTFLASVALWFCQIVFFVNFGTFMALTVLYSIAIALFFVLPLCSLIGPEGSTCDFCTGSTQAASVAQSPPSETPKEKVIWT
jgi:hypothetical protein